jgi:hypothetical protein
MKEITISTVENYNIWKQYEKMMNNKSIILTFINDGILEDELSSDLFYITLEEYKEECKKFYLSLVNVYEHYLGEANNKSIDFDVNFRAKTCILKKENADFDLDVFSMNTLIKDDIEQERIIHFMKKHEKRLSDLNLL